MTRRNLSSTIFFSIGFFLALHSALFASSEEFIPGDINGDGRIDGADIGILNEVLYSNLRVSRERIASMDFNGDGNVDMDDLVGLVNVVQHHAPVPAARRNPENPPRVIPRFADLRRNIPADQRVIRELERRLEQLTTSDRSRWDTTYNPDPHFMTQYESLLQDFNAALYYGLSPNSSRIFCMDLQRMGRTSAEAREQMGTYLNQHPVGRDYLESCARQGPDTTRHVDYSFLDYNCSLLGGIVPHAEGHADYTLIRSGGRIIVNMPVNLSYAPEVTREQRERFADRWTTAVRCAQNFWSRYGVEVHFDLDFESSHTLTVLPGDGRDDAAHFHVDGVMRNYECGLLLHESGHWMGLLDEYNEPGYRCNQALATQYDSIMVSGSSARVRTNSRWYPRHLERIFAPLCGRYPGQAY